MAPWLFLQDQSDHDFRDAEALSRALRHHPIQRDPELDEIQHSCRIILFGDEQGSGDVRREFALRHEPHVGRSEYGAPLVDTVFEGAQQVTKHNLLAYVNCDILLFQDFRKGLEVTGNWLIWRARHIRADVVDATPSVVAIHQNHDYSHHPQGVTGVHYSPESERNLKLAGGWKRLFTLKDANYELDRGELHARPFDCPPNVDLCELGKRFVLWCGSIFGIHFLG